MKCAICKEEFSKDDIRELKEMHEQFSLNGGKFICPDCLDWIEHMDLEEQLDVLMPGEEW